MLTLKINEFRKLLVALEYKILPKSVELEVELEKKFPKTLMLSSSDEEDDGSAVPLDEDKKLSKGVWCVDPTDK